MQVQLLGFKKVAVAPALNYQDVQSQAYRKSLPFLEY